MSENREGFYIRFINTFEPVDVDAWRLSVGGMVDNSRQMRYEDILQLPTASQASRMKCVEGWSAAAKWTGFRPQALIDVVKPQPDASWVHFHCEDGYYESIELNELLADRVLFVHGMNDGPLPPEYGAPLRLIVPFKYGYKGPKTINRITFSNVELRGFWPTMGRYTADGHILAGVDRALDLGTHRIFDKMGEIFYEEGLESQELVAE
jgi:DMSO/TMAO reductase YedYZ molybdopterin-dependent catalytic subunit